MCFGNKIYFVRPNRKIICLSILGSCSTRSYDSMSNVVHECNVKAPHRISSVSLRKYMATLTQVSNYLVHSGVKKVLV